MLEVIRSSQNAAIRRLVSLRNHRRRRDAKAVLIDGVRESRRAIESGLGLRGFFEVADHSGEGKDSAFLDDLGFVRQSAALAGVHRMVSPSVFAKIAYGQNERCVAEFDAPQRELSDLPDLQGGLTLVLDRIEKPGNIGAIFRTADAAGVRAILLCDCPTDAMNPNAIRASLGAVFTVRYAAGTWDEIADLFNQQSIRTLAMRVEGATPLYQTDLTGSVAIILGSEADGLGDRCTRQGDRPIAGITIPMHGCVDSLNVSVSAAIVSYESMRQRAIP